MNRLVLLGYLREVQNPLLKWKSAAEEIGRSWSGSYLGYHADVYYKDLIPPPPGTHFSQEWGPDNGWIEFDPQYISSAIRSLADESDTKAAEEFYIRAATEFPSQKLNATSILEIAVKESGDSFLAQLRDRIGLLSVINEETEIKRRMPQGKTISRDMLAMTQGRKLPQHIVILAQLHVIEHTLYIVKELSELTRQAASHILRLHQNQQKQGGSNMVGGMKIFIGHGHSLIWLELEKFIRDRLKLETDEFNRVPTAGRSNKERLSEMMNDASFAFLVMTGEDEQSDGEFHPRMNVVHEAGLFQGKLGFERAIVILEEGCESFSNIEGITQIRFPKGRISTTFEEIREVLELERVINAD